MLISELSHLHRKDVNINEDGGRAMYSVNKTYQDHNLKIGDWGSKKLVKMAEKH